MRLMDEKIENRLELIAMERYILKRTELAQGRGTVNKRDLIKLNALTWQKTTYSYNEDS